MPYKRSIRVAPEAKGICEKCKHVSDDGDSCKAFPDGIPLSILIGEFDHRKPYKSDNGIRFAAKK